MSGQLVLAELAAFRVILVKAGLGDSEKIAMWSRSTIANALHRLGPRSGMKEAAERAWQDADAFAEKLAHGQGPSNWDEARETALLSLDGLLSTVRQVKGTMPADSLR